MGDTVRFEYAPAWRPDPGQRDPVRIDLQVFSLEDAITRDIVQTKTFFEIDLLEHLAVHGPPGGTYIDVGANIGNHAVFFGKFLADHVVCVEPHAALIPILERNLLVNEVTSRSVLRLAAGAAPGPGRLATPPGCQQNIGRSRVTSVTEAAARNEVTVPIIPLDQALETRAAQVARMVSCVKIDVEGMELDVLRGAVRLLQSCRPQLVVELATEQARDSVRAFLAGFGYRDIGARFCWTPTFHFIDPRVHRLRDSPCRPRRDPQTDLLQSLGVQLTALIPEGQTFILVDQEQVWPGLIVDRRRRVPFLERDGEYWGSPVDDATAIRELQRLQADGASFLVFTLHAFWWLEHYAEFRRYLRSQHRVVLENDHLIVFGLGPAGAPGSDSRWPSDAWGACERGSASPA